MCNVARGVQQIQNFQTLAPRLYLKDLINRHQIRRQGLRSEDVYDKLEVPFAKRKTFASRAYSVAAPAWWNEIPNYVKQAGNVETFKKRLKTVLFDQFLSLPS